MEELQAAGGRVPMVQLLQNLRRYSSSSAIRRKITCRSRLCGSTICRPGSEQETPSSTTTSSNKICLRRGSLEVQGYNNCVPAVNDVDQLLIGDQWWDGAVTGQFGIWNMNFGPHYSATTLPLTIRQEFLLISGLHPTPASPSKGHNELIRSNTCRFKMGRWRGTQNRTCIWLCQHKEECQADKCSSWKRPVCKKE